MAAAPEESVRRPLPVELARLLHDLRGPLNSAVMHLEVLKRSVAADRVAEESLRTALQQVGRLADMLPAAFSVAALERSESRRLDLRALVVTAQQRFDVPGVAVADGGWPSVSGDEALLTLAIGHLLRNAVEATGDGARTPEVTGGAGDGQVWLRIRDWGAGLRTTNPKLLIRLLQSTKPGHAGLGLVTVERVARLHGGELRFESPGDGAIVTLSLPGAR